ncbi:MAG: Nif3-like dinuclear metal center hexameric protein, partial [Bacillota bacterium]
MESKLIYKKLNNKFIKKGLTDDWYQYMKSLKDYITPKFKKTNMGLMFDFNSEIKKVYTATFPS